MSGTLFRQMNRLADSVDRLYTHRVDAAPQAEKYVNKRETTADDEIDSSVSVHLRASRRHV